MPCGNYIYPWLWVKCGNWKSLIMCNSISNGPGAFWDANALHGAVNLKLIFTQTSSVVLPGHRLDVFVKQCLFAFGHIYIAYIGLYVLYILNGNRIAIETTMTGGHGNKVKVISLSKFRIVRCANPLALSTPWATGFL